MRDKEYVLRVSFVPKARKVIGGTIAYCETNVPSPLHQWVSDHRYFFNEREHSEEDISEWLMMHSPPFGTENKAIPKLFK